MESML